MNSEGGGGGVSSVVPTKLVKPTLSLSPKLNLLSTNLKQKEEEELSSVVQSPILNLFSTYLKLVGNTFATP